MIRKSGRVCSTSSITCESSSVSPTTSMSGSSAIVARTISLIRRGRFATTTWVFRTAFSCELPRSSPLLRKVPGKYLQHAEKEKVQLRATQKTMRVPEQEERWRESEYWTGFETNEDGTSTWKSEEAFEVTLTHVACRLLRREADHSHQACATCDGRGS